MKISSVENTNFKGNIKNCCGFLSLRNLETGETLDTKEEVEEASEELDNLFGVKDEKENIWLYHRQGAPNISGAFEINPKNISHIDYHYLYLKPTNGKSKYEACILYNAENNQLKSIWALNVYNTALNTDADIMFDPF